MAGGIIHLSLVVPEIAASICLAISYEQEVEHFMDGRIENLFVKVGHGLPMSEVDELTTKSGQGIVGDQSYGRKKRQVLLIEKEILDEFGLEPGWVRENITVSNITLTGLIPGSRLQLGEACLKVTGDCDPCQLIDDIKPGLRTEMEHRRGILGIVDNGGKVRVGDKVSLISRSDE